MNLNPIQILCDSSVNAGQIWSSTADAPTDQTDQCCAAFGLHRQRATRVTLTRVFAAVFVASTHHVRVDDLATTDRLHPRLARIGVQHFNVHFLQFAC